MCIRFLFLQTLESIKEYQWPTMLVEPLNLKQKGKIITEFFEKIYAKTLNTEQRELIEGASQTDNPLYLRTLLDEVSTLFSNIKSIILTP